MKLKSFRVTDYRSIIDSRECYLSLSDRITILAGQNESGKSSLLEALSFYESGQACPEAYRDEEDEKKIPIVSCTYTIDEKDNIYNKIFNSPFIEDELKVIIKESSTLSTFLKEIKEFKLERGIGSSKQTYAVILSRSREISATIAAAKSEVPTIELSEHKIRIMLGDALFQVSPTIILFNEFSDTLPEKISLKELTEGASVPGKTAVTNIQDILGIKFAELAEFSDTKVRKQEREYRVKISDLFNEKWQQRIADGTGTIISVKYHQGGKDGNPYLRFFIETRDDEALTPNKRSVGFKWFLSFFLNLAAQNKKRNNSILLFDEPGIYLHSKAQYDMLRMFEELSIKHQVIYTTHSPYLIDTNKLHRVFLIFNTKYLGTTVEKITTKVSPNQKDAMKPIIDAMGMQVAHDFSAAKDNNVIVEGISDYYYLTAAKKLLGISNTFYFMPAMGSSQAHLLMELCIGWGLNWLIIFDEKGSSDDIKRIKDNFFSDEESLRKKIFILEKCDGVEDIFTDDDIKLAAPSFARSSTLNKDLKAHGGKELIGRFFLDKVESGEITIDKLSEKARNHFTKIFDFIEQGFK